MKRANRCISILTLATALGAAAVPTRSEARGIDLGAGDGVGEVVAIGAGVTTGVLLLLGGALWYYWHHRHAAADAPTEPVEPVS